MSEQDRYIPGVPCWIDTTQPDPEAAAAFYGGLFGWEFEDVMPPGRRPAATSSPGSAAATSAAIGSQPEGAPRPAAWNTYVWVDGRRRDRRKVREAGGTRAHGAVRRRRRRAAWRSSPTRPAPRSASGRPSAHRGADGRQRARLAELQRPPHAATSRARRRSTARCSAGSCSTSATASMWALPALRRLPRAAHARHAREHGRRWARPERFEDVVASRRDPDDQADTPPHWGVTFGVDDADAIAARAAELGGRVARRRRSTRRGCA